VLASTSVLTAWLRGFIMAKAKPIILKLTPAEAQRLVGDLKPRKTGKQLFLRAKWLNGRLFVTHHRPRAKPRSKFVPSNAAFA
jgi:hypothetical protein